MKIFNNESGYVPMVPNLNDLWDKPFSELPQKLQIIVERRFKRFHWDKLNSRNRKRLAFQYDYENDPNNERSICFELMGFVNYLKELIDQEKQLRNYSAVGMLRDIEDRIKNVINCNRLLIGTEIQNLRELVEKSNLNELKVNDNKLHGNSENNALKREQILGAALSVLANWPEQCKNGQGKVEATKVRKLIEEKALLFWKETGDPPLSSETIEREIRKWLNTVN
jgi:hypothetical protein